MDGFPQELFDYIVDFLHDDQTSLAAVRLVAHAWNTAARAHLFRSLVLLTRYSHRHKPKYTAIDKLTSLLSLLDASRDIPDAVREVSLGRTTSHQDTYALLIPSVLRRFPHLSLIVFRDIDWANLAPSLLSSILHICNTRTLQRIELWNCQMPTTDALLDFLRASRNVKSLRLSYFKLTPDIDLQLPKPSPSALPAIPCHTLPCTSLLHTLAIDGSPDIFHLHCIQPFLLNLRRLYLGKVSDPLGVVEFLQNAGHSLEFLDICLSPSKQIQPVLSAIQSYCPRLQHLRISGLHWTPTLSPTDSLSSTLLITLPIQSIQLSVTVLKPKPITYFQDHDTDSKRTELRYSDWNILDTALSSPVFPVLKSFQLSLITIRERDVDPVRLSHMFPELKNKGVQVICCCT